MADTPVHLKWAKSGHAQVLSLLDDAIVLRSTISAPPGARLDATLQDATPVKIKSHGSHKEEDGTFTIKGRLFDATRETRQKVAALCSVTP